MTGQVVSAWFELDRCSLVDLANSHLLAESDESVLCRVRFYEITYRSLGTVGGRSAPSTGMFREAVVAYRGVYGETGGDVSALMVTDSFPYLAWGREAFGWPLELGEFAFHGLNRKQRDHHSSISTSVRFHASKIELDGQLGSVQDSAGAPQVTWLTPRSVPQPETGLELQQILVVRPRWISPGTRYEVSEAHIDVDPGEDPRLNCLTRPIRIVKADLLEDFELVVGEDVDVDEGEQMLRKLGAERMVVSQTEW